ncbi:MAG TPA: extracellular solute-binding protein [Pirellulaceae bacterium]|nr:extracellular solute-binding protein [Pirellulaceae bacterium]
MQGLFRPFVAVSFALFSIIAVSAGCGPTDSGPGGAEPPSGASGNSSSSKSTGGNSTGGKANSGKTGADESGSNEPLRVVVVDDPQLAAAIKKQWTAISQEPLEIRDAEPALLDAAEPAAKLNADIVIYPTAWLGTLAERRRLVPLPEDMASSDGFDRRNLLGLARQRECVWGQETYAVPLGSQPQLLLYRRDIFSQLNIKPPQTWDEFDALAKRLQKRESLGALGPPEGQPWSGSLEPTASPDAGTQLLARAAASVRHRSQYSTLFDFATMDPLLTSPAIVQALEKFVEVVKASDASAKSRTAAQVRDDFFAGRAAMALTWLPTPASGAKSTTEKATENPTESSTEKPSSPAGDTEDPAKLERWGVAPIPGATQMYNLRQKLWEPRQKDESVRVPLIGAVGRLGSVTRECKRRRSAWNFLILLSNSDWSGGVLSQSPATGPSRRAHLDDAARWLPPQLDGEAARQYVQVVRETQDEAGWMFVPRVPGRERYAAALDAAVVAALAGEKSPLDALTAASAEWQKITDELGRAEQRAAYRRCLGLEK